MRRRLGDATRAQSQRKDGGGGGSILRKLWKKRSNNFSAFHTGIENGPRRRGAALSQGKRAALDAYWERGRKGGLGMMLAPFSL